ncbi:hypothetical protein M413DRAFT_32317 [Hebeloma cylindrosporum]|uniref:F-box domain-containing protein n=1 Tax=Hebeloma cylindrosporum TaxID=76867 RepID=A0A0C2Y3L5_HEBCY|nr:hypothetical protein M413DRAFT_32317 [Hebeloma cylindrosporum h7]
MKISELSIDQGRRVECHLEIIDEVIDMIACEFEHDWHFKQELMKKCSLACKAFLHRSQQHLFSCIEIKSGFDCDNEKRAQMCQRLNNLLKQTPYFADYIRELHLRLPAKNNEWVSHDPTFLSIMDCISKSKNALQTLSFTGGRMTTKLQDPGAFTGRFSSRFVSPYISSLRIHWLSNIPIEILEACANLTRLELLDADFECSTRSAWEGHKSLPRLQTLAYSHSNSAVDKLLGKDLTSRPPVDLSTLRTLNVQMWEAADMQYAQEVLDVSYPSLEVLDILNDEKMSSDSQDELFTIKGHLNLAQCSKLRRFVMGILFGEPEIEALSGACDILKTVPTINRLQMVSLSIYVGFFSNTGPEGCFDADWEALGGELARISDGKDFEVMLYMNYYDPRPMVSTKKMNKLLKRCDSILGKLVAERLLAVKKCSNIRIMLKRGIITPQVY